MESPPPPFVGLIVVCGLSFAVFVIFRNIALALESRHWPKVSGTIIYSEIIRRMGDVDSPPSQVPDIRYRYKVGKREHVGRGINFHSLMGSHLTHRAAAKYPIGKRVEVYYHPRNPALSILAPGIGWLGLAGYSILIALIGVLIWMSAQIMLGRVS